MGEKKKKPSLLLVSRRYSVYAKPPVEVPRGPRGDAVSLALFARRVLYVAPVVGFATTIYRQLACTCLVSREPRVPRATLARSPSGLLRPPGNRNISFMAPLFLDLP